MPTTEAFSRAVIDAQLNDQGWSVSDGRSVRFECTLPDGKRADYLLCDRNGRGLAVMEAIAFDPTPNVIRSLGRTPTIRAVGITRSRRSLDVA